MKNMNQQNLSDSAKASLSQAGKELVRDLVIGVKMVLIHHIRVAKILI